jgi:hypothetical protein
MYVPICTVLWYITSPLRLKLKKMHYQLEMFLRILSFINCYYYYTYKLLFFVYAARLLCNPGLLCFEN